MRAWALRLQIQSLRFLICNCPTIGTQDYAYTYYQQFQARQFQPLWILHPKAFPHWILRYDDGYDQW